jgi:hypothetical protein
MSAAPNVDRIASINIRFPLGLSVVCGVLVVILTIAFYFSSGGAVKDTLIFFAACVAAAGQVTASFYTAKMLSSTISQNALARENVQVEAASRKLDLEARKEGQRYDMLKYTVRFGERWNDPNMYKCRDHFREISDFRGSGDELIAMVEARRTDVIHFINFLEEIASAKKHGLIINEIAKEQFDHIAITSWDKLFLWIRNYRIEKGEKKIWEEYEKLVIAWKS